jgi:hypothetical protein
MLRKGVYKVRLREGLIDPCKRADGKLLESTEFLIIKVA